MPIDSSFLREAQAAFNPYTPGSGTEHVAFLLYSLVRMTRPGTVVEYGSGYTTLFILQALADTAADVEEERAALCSKTAVLGDLTMFTAAPRDPRVRAWLDGGGKACGVNPEFYLEPYAPHLYSFEERDPSDRYAQRMAVAVETLRLAPFVTHLTAAVPSMDALPRDAVPIDLAWNDDKDYRDFFETFWPCLNPAGGLMVFHNTAAVRESWDDMQWIKARHAEANDLEVLTLCEPHKLNQNSCTVLRRVSAHVPRFLTEDAAPRILSSAIRFMTGDPSGVRPSHPR